MRKIQKTGSEIVIFENNQNQVLEMCMAMKFDAECNETTPAIISNRCHEDYEMFTENNIQKVSRTTQIVELEKKQGQIWNQRPLKRWRLPWPFLLRLPLKTNSVSFSF